MKIKIVMTHYFVKLDFTAARRPRVRRWDNEDMTGERLEVQRTIEADAAAIFRLLAGAIG